LPRRRKRLIQGKPLA